MSELSTRLRLRRKELGLSQEELAQRMGYRSKSSITKLEKGVNDLPQADRAALTGVLANDPRPSYQHDPQRVYGMEFGPLEVHFTVDGELLTVTGVCRR